MASRYTEVAPTKAEQGTKATPNTDGFTPLQLVAIAGPERAKPVPLETKPFEPNQLKPAVANLPGIHDNIKSRQVSDAQG